jgi:hypothetical protein
MAELAGRQLKYSLIKVFLNFFFEYIIVNTTHTLFVKYEIIKEISEKTCFLALLKNCENAVALLHYNNQAAAAVDYIMFNFDDFRISHFVWTGFIKESSHVWSK